jgi:DNA-directed RNA polymerase subunit RPC12/RpoP
MPDVVGCSRCGYVARRDSLEDSGHRCPDCGTALVVMAIETARRLVVARRRADKRRSDAAKAAEVGLDAAPS